MMRGWNAKHCTLNPTLQVQQLREENLQDMELSRREELEAEMRAKKTRELERLRRLKELDEEREARKEVRFHRSLEQIASLRCISSVHCKVQIGQMRGRRGYQRIVTKFLMILTARDSS